MQYIPSVICPVNAASSYRAGQDKGEAFACAISVCFCVESASKHPLHDNLVLLDLAGGTEAKRLIEPLCGLVAIDIAEYDLLKFSVCLQSLQKQPDGLGTVAPALVACIDEKL